MAQGLDQRKRREWVKRFERYRASGATVAHFCGHERVSVNTFYYWSKRVRSAAALEQPHPAGEELGRVAAAVQPGARRDDAQALVRFRFGSMEVDVPAGCLDVIRCLAESAGRCDAQVAPPTSGAFHEIVLTAQR
jgi:hypothetical protein